MTTNTVGARPAEASGALDYLCYKYFGVFPPSDASLGGKTQNLPDASASSAHVATSSGRTPTVFMKS